MSGLKDIESWLRKKTAFYHKKNLGRSPKQVTPKKPMGKLEQWFTQGYRCKRVPFLQVGLSLGGDLERTFPWSWCTNYVCETSNPKKKGVPKKIPNSPKLIADLISWDVLKGLNLNVVMLPLIRNPDNLIQNSYKKGWCPSSTTGKQWKKPHYMSWYCLVNRDPGEILIMNYHGSNWVVKKKTN